MIERYRPSANIAPLLYWAKERDSIRKKKAWGEPPPWASDPILQKYRFCNVRRADDRVSQWMFGNVLQDQAEFDDTMTFIKLVAVCRWVNWPPTLQVLIDREHVTQKKIDLPAIGRDLDNLVKMDVKAWTGAYMVRAPSKKKYPGMGKGKFVSEVVVGALDSVRRPLLLAIAANQAKLVWETVCSVPNWGSFMAGQLVADLTYTPLLNEAYDLNTWAPQGPGSRRGFNRLMGRSLKAKINDDEWSEKLQEWRLKVVEAIGSELNLMDLQNCLCETDKYLRAKNGEGRPRSTYKPETAY